MDENGHRVLRGEIVCNVWPQVGRVIVRSCSWGEEKGGKVTIRVERQGEERREAREFMGLYC